MTSTFLEHKSNNNKKKSNFFNFFITKVALCDFTVSNIAQNAHNCGFFVSGIVN